MIKNDSKRLLEYLYQLYVNDQNLTINAKELSEKVNMTTREIKNAMQYLIDENFIGPITRTIDEYYVGRLYPKAIKEIETNQNRLKINEED